MRYFSPNLIKLEARQSIINDLIKLLPYFFLFTLITWYVSDNFFFWDTVQFASQHASFFYSNNFSKVILPNKLDSGHIPVFGMYLAFCWIIFGKTLLVSHFTMLPFLFGIIWQSYKLLNKFISQKYIHFALTLFFADATLLSQSILVTPDIPLVFLFLLALNSVLSQRKYLTSIAIAGLFLISMRGMMVSVAILLIDIIINIRFIKLKPVIVQLASKTLVYIPALIIFSSFNIYHFILTGWIGYHEDSPWANSFQIVDLMGFGTNLRTLAWRVLDYGRIFLWAFTIPFLIIYLKRLLKDKNIRMVLIIFFIVLISLSISFLLYRSLSAHRYILPVFLVFSLFTSYLIFEKLKFEKLKYIIFTLLLIGLLSGNLWVYPQRFPQGWDSTLAHYPYYKLRVKMLDYMEDNQIKVKNVACVFPNTFEFKYIDLSDNMQKHQEKNLDINKYVLFSNIYNDYFVYEMNRLESDFILVKEFKQRGVFIRLYKNNF